MRRAGPHAEASIMSGYDPDGIAQTEADYSRNVRCAANGSTCETWRRWPCTSTILRMLRLPQARRCAARRAGAVSDDLKDLRPTHVAVRILFALRHGTRCDIGLLRNSLAYQ
jgi:hypothetical protein